MWKTWKKTVLGFVSAVAGIALLSALLERPLSAPLSASAAASVLGGYDDCYTDGTANCPDDKTCHELEVEKGEYCYPWPAPPADPDYYVCPYSVDISTGTYQTRASYEFAVLTEDPGYTAKKNLSSFYCHERWSCASYCAWIPEDFAYECVGQNSLNYEVSRIPTVVDRNNSDVCNLPLP